MTLTRLSATCWELQPVRVIARQLPMPFGTLYIPSNLQPVYMPLPQFIMTSLHNIEELPCPSLASAILDNAAGLKTLCTDRKLFVFSLGLNWKSEAQRHRRDAKIATIPRISVTSQAGVYPPPNAIVAGTPEIGEMWRKWITFRKLKDK